MVAGLGFAFFIYLGEIIPVVIAKWYLLLVASGITVVALANQVIGYRHLLGKDGKWIDFRALLGVWAFSNLLNYLGPFQPGTIARSAFLRKHGIPLKTSLMASLNWVLVNVFVGMALLALCLIGHPDRKFSFFGGALFLLIIFWFVYGGKVMVWIANAFGVSILEGGFSSAMLQSLRIGPAHFFALNQYLMLTITYFILYRSFSPEFGVVDALGVATLVPLSTLIAITPNGVGIVEGLIAYFAFKSNLAVPEGVFIVFVLRASHILVCAIIMLLNIGELRKWVKLRAPTG